LLKKELRFKLLSSIDGVRALILAAISIIFAVMGLRYWTLVLAAVASALLATVMTLTQRRHRFSWPRFRDLKAQMRFSRDIVVINLAWALYSNADFIVAGRRLGQAALGAYTVAWNFANAPLEKITSLVGSVTPAYFSAVQNDDAALRRYVLKPTEAIAFLTFPTMIGMALVTHDAVLLLLGARWQQVIGPMQVLCVYVCFRSIMTLLPQVLTVKRDTRFVMYNALISLVILPLSFFFGSRWGTQGIALAWVMAYPLNAVPFYLRTAKKIGLRFSEYYNALRPAIEGSVLMAIGVCAVKWIIPANTTPALRLGAEFVTGVVTYAGIELLLHRGRLGMFKRAAQMIRT
jgi:PST family polysaccharide transporter